MSVLVAVSLFAAVLHTLFMDWDQIQDRVLIDLQEQDKNRTRTGRVEMTTLTEHARELIESAMKARRAAAEVKRLGRYLDDLEGLVDLTPAEIIGCLLLGTGIAIAWFLSPGIGSGMVVVGIVIMVLALDAKVMRRKRQNREIQRGIEDLEERLSVNGLSGG